MKTANFTQLAEALAIQKEIKVAQFYGTNYDKTWVYIPRIYHGDYKKAKIRVLKNGDNVKNCLKITFNPDKYDRSDIERIIYRNIAVLKNELHGTCQNHLTKSSLLKVLTGILGKNGLPTEEAKKLIHN